jgi:hypothetical protein
MVENIFSMLELMLNHEIQIHAAIKKKEWKVARKHIEAMLGLLPKYSTPTFVCKIHHRILSVDFICRDHGRVMKEDEYDTSKGSF